VAQVCGQVRMDWNQRIVVPGELRGEPRIQRNANQEAATSEMLYT